jgi:hypothetical protein
LLFRGVLGISLVTKAFQSAGSAVFQYRERDGTGIFVSDSGAGVCVPLADGLGSAKVVD